MSNKKNPPHGVCGRWGRVCCRLNRNTVSKTTIKDKKWRVYLVCSPSPIPVTLAVIPTPPCPSVCGGTFVFVFLVVTVLFVGVDLGTGC